MSQIFAIRVRQVRQYDAVRTVHRCGDAHIRFAIGKSAQLLMAQLQAQLFTQLVLQWMGFQSKK